MTETTMPKWKSTNEHTVPIEERKANCEPLLPFRSGMGVPLLSNCAN